MVDERGVYLKDIPEEQKVSIETQNRCYTLLKRNGKVFLSGHPEHCARLTEVRFNSDAFFGRGKRLVCTLPNWGTMTTSEIKKVSFVG